MSLARAVELLSASRWAEGARVLAGLVAQDLPDAQRGPAHGMYAQALLELGRVDEAKSAVREAMRVAKRLGDMDGLTALRGLNGRIYEALARQQDQERVRREEAETRARPLAELLDEANTAAERAAVYVQKANAQLDQGSEEDSVALARTALELATAAGATRETVLARLCLARAEPDAVDAHLRAAHAVADQAEEAQLVAAIARAARAAGVDFGTHRF